MLTAIWAHAKNGIIGKDNDLPWSIPNDMRFFKQQTLGKSVVMGRRTFESMGCRPLPHRTNYVLTQEEDFKATWEGKFDNLQVITDKQTILTLQEKEEVMVIGGATIYRLFWEDFDQLLITNIQEDIEGDTQFLPDLQDFECYKVEEGQQDEKNLLIHQFEFWRRKENPKP